MDPTITWQQVLVILGVGIAIGWLRPGLEAVRTWRHHSRIIESAGRLGRYDRNR